ncbi:MAG TPA: hypothetical protein ENN19_18535 [Chloroflexi bacterium]|nr:hypothetical protein [Chloroflexota bacterium]
MTTKSIRRTLRSIAPFIGLALAVLPAAWPYFGGGFPRTNDALPHLYRSLALSRLVRQGVLWPRWSPDLVHGYGYPVFNFSPALSHYLIVLFHLAGPSLTTAYRAAMTTILALTACSTYLLGRDLFGAVGGWVAALAYVYSPYVLYDALVRGSLQESLALALVPLLFFSLRRATRYGGRWIAASALSCAAIPLSHPPISIQVSIPTGIFLLWLGCSMGWHRLWRPLAGLALGGLLMAFFWIPAFTEVQYVQTEIAVSRGYHYPNNFMPLKALIAWPRLPADPALVNPPVVRSLPLLALAIAAIMLPWRRRSLRSTQHRIRVGLCLCVLLICTMLILPLSRPLWDHLSLLQLSLYPWRFLGLTSLAGALVLAGISSGPKRLPTLPLLLIIAALLIGAIPWLYPPREAVPESPTLAHVTAFEQPPLFIGTTTLGEFLPIWVEQLPDTTELRQQLISDPSTDRLIAAEGVIVQQSTGSPLDAAYVLHAERPATLTYRQFYFPGWRVELDGEAIPIRPSQPEGLLSIDVPAGEHHLHIRFGLTPPRLLGWALTGLGLLGLISLLIFGPRWAAPEPGPSLATFSETTSRMPLSQLALLTGAILVIWLLFSRIDTPLRATTLTPEGLRGVPNSLALDFAGELRLLGYEQTQHPISADDDVHLTLYWRALRPIGVHYDVVVHIVDRDGLKWDTQQPGRPSDWRWAPGTDSWTPERYVMDPYVLQLLDGAPPGEYAFRVSLVRRDTKQTIDTHHIIGHLLVAQPARDERPLEVGMTPVGLSTGDMLEALGSRIDRRQAAPGEPVRATILWQAQSAGSDSSLTRNPSLTLNLVTQGGTPILTTTSAIAPHYPVADWRPGDRLRTETLLRLPAHTPPGEHVWRAQIDQAHPITLPHTLAVRELDRQWDPPALAIQLDAQLPPVATLLGANVEPSSCQIQASQPVTVTLAWRAEAEVEISYRVFVHLVGPDGDIVAQRDGEPANWTRPTTGWLPGEVVLDERVLDVPANASDGSYTLICGLYEPDTGQRLKTQEGLGTIQIIEITIQ